MHCSLPSLPCVILQRIGVSSLLLLGPTPSQYRSLMIRAIMGDWLPFKVGGEEDHLVDQGAGAGVCGTEQTCSIT